MSTFCWQCCICGCQLHAWGCRHCASLVSGSSWYGPYRRLCVVIRILCRVEKKCQAACILCSSTAVKEPACTSLAGCTEAYLQFNTWGRPAGTAVKQEGYSCAQHVPDHMFIRHERVTEFRHMQCTTSNCSSKSKVCLFASWQIMPAGMTMCFTSHCALQAGQPALHAAG